MGQEPAIPSGIPVITFDFFDLGEVPNFILCNPNKEELFALGGISNRSLAAKFNTYSEISFRADKTIDGNEMEYYDYLVNKRLVNIISSGSSIGYFMITDVSETDDGISKYKEVTGQSLEIEMASKKLVAYVSGSVTYDGEGKIVPTGPVSVTLDHLLNDLIDGVDTSGSVTYIPEWIHGVVPGNNAPYPQYDTIGNRSRGFDISDKTIYDFLMTDVEAAYGCVFNFDTINKIIYVYSPEEAITNTDIFVSHDNIIKNLNIKEVTDELATTISVLGGDGLDIRDINPLGNNNIYKFDYFLDTTWMKEDLIDSINAWQDKIISASGLYASTTEQLYNDYDQVEYYDAWVQTYSGSLAVLNTELQVFTDNGIPTGEVEQQIEVVTQLLSTNTILRDTWNQTATSHFNIAKGISRDLSLTNFRYDDISIPNFTEEQYIRLQPFIIESSYVNDNIAITSNMSASTIYQKAYQLYNSASGVLLKMSEPKYTFEIEAVNLMQIKEFQEFRDQLVLGAEITVQTSEEKIISAILLEIDMNFDDPTDFKLVFGNRLRMDNESFKFSDLMNKAIDSGNSAKVYSQKWNKWTRDYQTTVTNTIKPLDTTYGLAINAPAIQNIFDRGYKEGVYINTGSFVNIVTPALLWNGYPIGGAGGGAVLEGPGIDINGITVGLGGDTVLLYYGNAPVAEFNTITAALAAAQSGNTVVLPPGIFSEDIVIPAGVTLTGTGNQSIISGSVILLGNNSTATNIIINISRSTSTETYGVRGPDSGAANLFDVWISIVNIGGGHTYGLLIGDGNILVRDGGIIAISYGIGNAVGMYQKALYGGTGYSDNNRVYGTANGTGKGHAFATSGIGDIFVTTGIVYATTSPVGEI